MRSGSLDEISDVLKWDWAAIRRGELPPVGRRSADPALFVCTNGKKDACCAIHGRRVIDDLRQDPELTGQIFEASHLTGHRFAPTALLLPWGYLYGRLDATTAREALSLAWSGQTLSSQLRGRTALPAWAQVADLAVRTQESLHPVDSLDVVTCRNGKPFPAAVVTDPLAEEELQVRHLDGRTWQVRLEAASVAPRPVSCGDEPAPAVGWQAMEVRKVADWR